MERAVEEVSAASEDIVWNLGEWRGEEKFAVLMKGI